MKLSILRERYTPNSTVGSLLIDGQIFCYTLEPRKDQSKGKPYCIPAGLYQATLAISPRFTELKKYPFRVPLLSSVPDFTSVEIHIGNLPHDTEGCTLVGFARSVDAIQNSEEAFFRLFHRLAEPLEVEYIDTQEKT